MYMLTQTLPAQINRKNLDLQQFPGYVLVLYTCNYTFFSHKIRLPYRWRKPFPYKLRVKVGWAAQLAAQLHKACQNYGFLRY